MLSIRIKFRSVRVLISSRSKGLDHSLQYVEQPRLLKYMGTSYKKYSHLLGLTLLTDKLDLGGERTSLFSRKYLLEHFWSWERISRYTYRFL